MVINIVNILKLWIKRKKFNFPFTDNEKDSKDRIIKWRIKIISIRLDYKKYLIYLFNKI